MNIVVKINKLPKLLVSAIKKTVLTFEKGNVEYWLGGGLYQLILEGRYKDIKKKWKNHDTDFHIWHRDKEKVKSILQQASFDEVRIYEPNKISFIYEGYRMECLWLFERDYTPGTVYFLSWGKKENWPLSQSDRQLFYHFSLPASIFKEPHFLDFADFKVRVPKKEYVSLIYCSKP